MPHTRDLIVFASLCIGAFAWQGGAQDYGADSPPVSDEAPSATGYRLEQVLGNLTHPWAIAWLPSDDMLITERRGTLRFARKDGTLAREPIAGLPDIFSHGQGGLMEVSLHPEFEDNRLVYLTYAIGSRNANRTALGAGKLSADHTRLENFTELFRVDQVKSGGQHFGSRIVWLPDNTMLLAIGDGGNPPIRLDGELIRKQAQNKSAHLGKVLRLDEQGKPAQGNPFADDPSANAAVYTLGHRNIQGMVRNPDTGTVWATEHGARGGDELNIITPGSNYGWPEVTYSREYFGPEISDRTSAPQFEDPKLVWVPSKAPSGLELCTSDKYPQWQGDLFSGALVLKHIRIIDLEDEKVVGETSIPTDARVRDIAQGPDGFLYYLTDEPNGSLMCIIPTDH